MILDISKHVAADEKLQDDVIRLTTSVVQALNIGLQNTLVGIMFFAKPEKTRYHITLNQYTNKPDLLQELNSTVYPSKGGANFESVFHLLSDTAFNQSYGFRPDFPNVGIIMTAKTPRDNKNLSTTVQKFHSDCIFDDLYAVGLSNDIDIDQLELITDNKSNVFHAENITPATIARVELDLIQRLCQETSKCNKFYEEIINVTRFAKRDLPHTSNFINVAAIHLCWCFLLTKFQVININQSEVMNCQIR